jgi:aminoglycoside phosphotransferase family enzyme
MTKEQVDNIIQNDNLHCVELIETHISWVIFSEQFAFKIKKPIKYPFLDFSTIEKRKYYCEKELELNRRFSEDLYIDVQPVMESQGQIYIGNNPGKTIDYAVKMKKLDRKRQMDILLRNNGVSEEDIRKLAKKIADFHKTARIIYTKNFDTFQKDFNDLKTEKAYLSNYLGSESIEVIDHAIETSDQFVKNNKGLLNTRLHEGFFRDCHGDLHSRNIFLLPDPQLFDCIEFNDDFRQIDVLNELAFLCMDLDVFGRRDLSRLLLNCYNMILPLMKGEEEYQLFVYYKIYRANVRAKVNSLRARDAVNDSMRKIPLGDAEKYLKLIMEYLKTFNRRNVNQ